MNLITIILSTFLLLANTHACAMDWFFGCKKTYINDLWEACDFDYSAENQLASIEIVRSLLKAGSCDIHAKDNTGNNLLHAACSAGSEQLIEIFFKKGVDINGQANNGDTPLHEQCRFASVQKAKMVCALLQCPTIDVNIKNENGNTPIFLPLQTLQPGLSDTTSTYAILNMLIDSGKVNLKKKNANNETFFYYWHDASIGRASNFPPLNFFTNFTQEERETFLTNELHHAAKVFKLDYYNHMQVFIQFCLDHGADINHRNYKKQRPLDIAAEEYQRVEGHLSYRSKAFVTKQQIYYKFLKNTPYSCDKEICHRLASNGLTCDAVKKIMGYYTALVTVHRAYARLASPIVSKKKKKEMVGNICKQLDYTNPYAKKQLTTS